MMDDFDRVRMQRYVADNVTPRSRASRRDEVMAQLYATPSDAEPKDVPQEDDTIREAELLRDETFAEYARDIHKLYEGRPFQGTQREAAQYGLDIMGEFYFNFAGPGIGDNPGTLMQAGVLLTSGTADNAKQFLYMLDQYERLPNWTGSGLARAFDGIFSDPSTYAGLASLGTGFVARKMAASTARAGIRLQLKNVAQKAMSSEGAVGAFTRTTAQYPAAVTGGVTAAQGSISDIAEQAIESKAGYEMDIEDRIKRNLIVTGISGAAGYGLAKGAGVVGRGISDYAAGAPDRLREAKSGVTLGMGVDPTQMVDEVIVAGQKLMGNVDEARAAYEASPNDPALKQQYLDLRRQRDAQLSQMSPSEQLELDVDYRMDHQPRGPQDGGGRLDDITAGGELFPEDVYSADGLRLYGNPNNAFDRESHAAIMAARGNPDAEITIYRAVPQNIDQINPGDWVTLSPEYAAVHAASGYGPDGQQAGKVISQRVRVKDVYSDGNDLNEFGFFPSELADAGVKKIVPPTETEPGIIAFHGSGADFDEFRLEMIGTGEGAQAYGYGLYFTDSEDIAKFYRDTVRAQKNLSQGADIKYQGKEFVDYGDTAEAEAQPPEYFAVRKIASQMMREKSPDVAKGLVLKKLKAQMANRTGDTEIDDLIRNSLKIEIDAVNAINPNEIQVEKGKIFKVGISAKPEEMLDYQTTFADQPQSVQDALRAVGYDTETASTIEKTGDGRHTVFYIDTKGREARQDFIDGVAGQTSEQQAKEFASKQDEMRSKLPMPVVLDALKETLKKQMEAGEIPVDRPDKVLSERLSAEGVPGIKYRAAGSRAASIDAADAEMNYVIFDENAIKILEKYGIVGPVAITAVAAGQGADSDEGEVM